MFHRLRPLGNHCAPARDRPPRTGHEADRPVPRTGRKFAPSAPRSMAPETTRGTPSMRASLLLILPIVALGLAGCVDVHSTPAPKETTVVTPAPAPAPAAATTSTGSAKLWARSGARGPSDLVEQVYCGRIMARFQHGARFWWVVSSYLPTTASQRLGFRNPPAPPPPSPQWHYPCNGITPPRRHAEFRSRRPDTPSPPRPRRARVEYARCAAPSPPPSERPGASARSNPPDGRCERSCRPACPARRPTTR